MQSSGRQGAWMVAGAVAVGLAAGGVWAAAGKGALEFPANHRDFAHAKSMVIPDRSHGLYGFHHIYVSPNARAAYQQGRFPLPEGTTLVASFYDVENKDGAIHQGAQRMVAVMKKDRAATETGGWRYGAFDGAGKPMDVDVVQGCYVCHTGQKSRDYVFSSWQ